MDYLTNLFLCIVFLLYASYNLYKSIKPKTRTTNIRIVLNSIFVLIFVFSTYLSFRVPSYTEITDEQYKIVFDTYINENISDKTRELIKEILSDGKIIITEYNNLLFQPDIIETINDNDKYKRLINRYNDSRYI